MGTLSVGIGRKAHGSNPSDPAPDYLLDDQAQSPGLDLLARRGNTSQLAVNEARQGLAGIRGKARFSDLVDIIQIDPAAEEILPRPEALER
jgi:hypothetical protein